MKMIKAVIKRSVSSSRRWSARRHDDDVLEHGAAHRCRVEGAREGYCEKTRP